jgi:hypothetical protein
MSNAALPEVPEGVGKQESDRFYCPYPGCKRSFAELWRLKVHYRAPPDIRGSGKERGHGTELTHCPKCGKALKPGKHHVGCSAGKTAPRQATKRSRVVSREHDVESGDGPGCCNSGSQCTKKYEVRRVSELVVLIACYCLNCPGVRRWRPGRTARRPGS